MNYTVDWEPLVVEQMSRFMPEHHAELEVLIAFLDSLEKHPRPENANPWGPEHYRARVDQWRVMYRVHDGRRMVNVEHIGRVPEE